jgi:hypothetical protein
LSLQIPNQKVTNQQSNFNNLFRVKRSFWEYIRDEDSRAARRSLITDLLCFFLLTPLVLISSIICCISSIQLINEEKEDRQNDENGGLRFEIAIG